MQITLPKLQQWQQDAYCTLSDPEQAKGKTFVIKSGRQRGKSFLILTALLTYALKKPGSISVVVCPVSYQGRRLQRQFVKSIKNTDMVQQSNLADSYVYLKNSSEIHFKSAESGENLRGITVSGILIIDEAAFVSDDIFEIIYPFCNVHRAPKLLVSTPMFASGYFYNEYSDPKNVTFDWSMEKYDFSIFLSDEDYERYRMKYSVNKFKSEILGQFIENTSAVFGDFMSCVMKPFDTTPVYGGIDFASGTGNDSTVLTLMNQYKQVVYRFETNDMQPVFQIEQLASILNGFQTLKAVYAEMNSIGTVYFSVLQGKLKNKAVLREFTTTNASKREIIENLILAFQSKDIGIDDSKTLHYQLSCFEIKKLSTGYTYGNADDDAHDDHVMSLALCYHNFDKPKVGSFGFTSGSSGFLR